MSGCRPLPTPAGESSDTLTGHGGTVRSACESSLPSFTDRHGRMYPGPDAGREVLLARQNRSIDHCPEIKSKKEKIFLNCVRYFKFYSVRLHFAWNGSKTLDGNCTLGGMEEEEASPLRRAGPLPGPRTRERRRG